LRDEPIAGTAVHLCVDMQRMYGPGTPWAVPWMTKVVPRIGEICERHSAQTVFTRFIPARRPGEGSGQWRRYYRKWASMTLEAIGPEMVEVVPELARYVPPAETFDKPVYSPWIDSRLHDRLQMRGCDTLVLTGGETDMCVLATLLGAVDWGYRAILVHDALCSSSDESHEAMIGLFSARFSEQVETASVEEVLSAWPGEVSEARIVLEGT